MNSISWFRVFVFSWPTLALASNVARAQQPSAKPDCTVSDVTVPASATPAAKPAPTAIAVDTRKAIFRDLQQVVARAQREAAAAYPTAEGGAMLAPTNVQKDSTLAGKRAGMALALERTYLVDVLKRRSLTCAAAREIAREGVAAHWPKESLK